MQLLYILSRSGPDIRRSPENGQAEGQKCQRPDDSSTVIRRCHPPNGRMNCRDAQWLLAGRVGGLVRRRLPRPAAHHSLALSLSIGDPDVGVVSLSIPISMDPLRMLAQAGPRTIADCVSHKRHALGVKVELLAQRRRPSVIRRRRSSKVSPGRNPSP